MQKVLERINQSLLLVVNGNSAERLLKSVDVKFKGVRVAHSLTEALKFIQQNDIDFIISDFDLPDSKGVNTVVNIREKFDGPLLIFLDTDNFKEEFDVISAKATDYLVKEFASSEDIKRRIIFAAARYSAEKALNNIDKKISQAAVALENILPIITKKNGK